MYLLWVYFTCHKERINFIGVFFVYVIIQSDPGPVVLLVKTLPLTSKVTSSILVGTTKNIDIMSIFFVVYLVLYVRCLLAFLHLVQTLIRPPSGSVAHCRFG